jgi:hypothetical protein
MRDDDELIREIALDPRNLRLMSGGPPDDPYLPAMFRGYMRCYAFEKIRSELIANALDKGHMDLVENGRQQYAVFTLDKLHESIGPSDPRPVENYFRGMLPLGTLLSSDGRAHRQIVKSMRAEWRDTRRLRLRVFDDLTSVLDDGAARQAGEDAVTP